MKCSLFFIVTIIAMAVSKSTTPDFPRNVKPSPPKQLVDFHMASIILVTMATIILIIVKSGCCFMNFKSKHIPNVWKKANVSKQLAKRFKRSIPTKPSDNVVYEKVFDTAELHYYRDLRDEPSAPPPSPILDSNHEVCPPTPPPRPAPSRLQVRKTSSKDDSIRPVTRSMTRDKQ